jgi:hypothetical protein
MPFFAHCSTIRSAYEPVVFLRGRASTKLYVAACTPFAAPSTTAKPALRAQTNPLFAVAGVFHECPLLGILHSA